jgi:hypothetical protein
VNPLFLAAAAAAAFKENRALNMTAISQYIDKGKIHQAAWVCGSRLSPSAALPR